MKYIFLFGLGSKKTEYVDPTNLRWFSSIPIQNIICEMQSQSGLLLFYFLFLHFTFEPFVVQFHSEMNNLLHFNT